MNTIDAFILIGGKSSRMGEPKHLIEIHGTTMLDLILDQVRFALPESRVRLVTSAGIDTVTSGVEYVKDVFADRGAWSGVHAALVNSKSEWTFVIACDFPLISSSLIRNLALFVNEHTDTVIPRQPDGRPQPLCAFYRTTVCRKLANSILSSGETPALLSMSDSVRTKFVAFEECGTHKNEFLNANSWQEVEKAVSLLDANGRVVAE